MIMLHPSQTQGNPRDNIGSWFIGRLVAPVIRLIGLARVTGRQAPTPTTRFLYFSPFLSLSHS